MDTAQWPQGIVVKPIDEIVTNSCPKPAAANNLERKARPQKEQALNCPRCNSTNTKFCYYNNYSLTQPRYFCKTCRRYWTEGGSLRNIPVGGGSRKNKRSSSLNNSPSTTSNNSSSSSASKRLPDLIHQNPKINQSQDLNLTFPSTNQDFRTIISDHLLNHHHQQFPNNNINNENTNKQQNHISSSSPTSTTTTTTTSHLSALELLTGLTSRGLNSFMPMPVSSDPNNNSNTVYNSPSGLINPMQDFKPTLNFSIDGLGSGYGSLQGHHVQESSGTLLFPFEDLKQAPSGGGINEENKEHGDSAGYWTGMLGGGSW
ncbi:hypothetical protein FF1_014936 [Malus domestica]